jgi:hypothetical protein
MNRRGLFGALIGLFAPRAALARPKLIPFAMSPATYIPAAYIVTRAELEDGIALNSMAHPNWPKDALETEPLNDADRAWARQAFVESGL